MQAQFFPRLSAFSAVINPDRVIPHGVKERLATMELKDIVEKGIFEKVGAEEGELTALKISCI